MEFCKSDKTVPSTASLPHSVVIDTMSKLNMPLFLIRWIQAFLTNRTQQVRVNDKLSIRHTPSTLSPNSEMSTSPPPHTHLIMFDDDAATIGLTLVDAQVTLLQRDVDRVVGCFAGLELHGKINAKKSQHLFINISPTGPRDTKPLMVDLYIYRLEMEAMNLSLMYTLIGPQLPNIANGTPRNC